MPACVKGEIDVEIEGIGRKAPISGRFQGSVYGFDQARQTLRCYMRQDQRLQWIVAILAGLSQRRALILGH